MLCVLVGRYWRLCFSEALIYTHTSQHLVTTHKSGVDTRCNYFDACVNPITEKTFSVTVLTLNLLFIIHRNFSILKLSSMSPPCQE